MAQQLRRSQTLRVRPARKGKWGRRRQGRKEEGTPGRGGPEPVRGGEEGAGAAAATGTPWQGVRLRGRGSNRDRRESPAPQHRQGEGSDTPAVGKHATGWALSAERDGTRPGRGTSTASTVVMHACWFGFCLSCG